MTERNYLYKAIAALEDALAYLAPVEEVERKKGKKGTVYAVQNCRQSILQTHDACALLLKEVQ